MNNNLLSNITEKQNTDTGMAMTLIALLLGYFLETDLFYIITIFLLIFTMTVPNIFKLLSLVWFGISKYLGTIVSKIILSIIYSLLVIPVGLTRKILGKDTLKLKNFKKDTASVFLNRDYKFTSNDLEKPY